MLRHSPFSTRSVQANGSVKRVRATFSTLTVYFIISTLESSSSKIQPQQAPIITPIKPGCSKTFLHRHNHAAVSTFSPQRGWCEPGPCVCGGERERGQRERGQRRAKDWCHCLNHLTKSPTSYSYSRGQQGGRRKGDRGRERVKGRGQIGRMAGKNKSSKWEVSIQEMQWMTEHQILNLRI